jgi:hypothetical protein
MVTGYASLAVRDGNWMRRGACPIIIKNRIGAAFALPMA